MRAGRPLRFLGVTLGGWTAIRVALLLPDIDSGADLIRAVAPPLAAATLEPKPLRTPSMARGGSFAGTGVDGAWPGDVRPQATNVRTAADPTRIAFALAGLVRYGQAVPIVVAPGSSASSAGITPPLRPSLLSPTGGRLSGSAWLLARGGSAGTLSGGRLGGSQAGVRLTYALDADRRLAVAARVATPLQGKGREAAVGIEWRPAHLPVRLVAEQRLSLDGGRGGPTLMAVGGIGPVPLAAGFRLEAYAQGGAVARDRVEGFADGAARATRPIATFGPVRIDLGGGVWGAAQRDAGRLDAGPTLGMAVPVAGRALRMTLDWRQRIAGDARPGSGPAFSIGTDF